MIEPRTVSGFRDYAPNVMIPRERILQTARNVYRSFGFTPIDTPAAESLDVLLGKGGDESDKLVYRVRGAKQEREEMGLRFDLTVPFARFAAKNINDLGTPFKRYAMGPVWRGERPGQGRYREFWQCDFDTIGTTANASDTEVVLVVNELFAALEIPRVEIRVNSRLILNGLLESLGIADKAVPLLRSLDKLQKIGREKVIEEMVREAGVSASQASQVLALAETSGTNEDVLRTVSELFAGVDNKSATDGIRRLMELLAVAAKTGVPEGRIKIDLSIARGLDYYTGLIFETFLLDLPAIGSVCSGGRYDNLASLYTKQVLPGVGGSLGVDRLLAAMEELKHPWLTGATTPAAVLILQLDADLLGEYQQIAKTLRDAGIATEVYPDTKKLGQQFQYAEKRGYRIGVIAGGSEMATGTVKVKDLTAKQETTVPRAELAAVVQKLLAGPS
ncbi:histidine--tRNA ligase [Limnoglobus roseus]|uniref:histidine--tRNA ligase n=1 Tax=Limnoglobus roseus TaxID=2598579 RepID=UPI0036F3357E